MNKVKIVIVEDEFLIAEDIRMKLNDSGYEAMAIFDRAEEALPFIIKECPDITLVDINLAGTMDGIELVKHLQLKMQLPIVYITANSDKATYDRAKATHPNAFLIKPFNPANLLASIDLALFNFSKGDAVEQIDRHIINNHDQNELLINQSLFIRINNRYTKIHSDNILFIEASGSYVHVQTLDHRYTLSQNLTHFQRRTPLPNLIRIHRSFIVNINKVDAFEESCVFVQNHKLPLSENHKTEFLARIHCL